MAYYGNAPADVALVVGQDVITTTEIQDATIATADIASDAITATKIDDDGTGFQMGSLGLGTAVSGSHKLTVGGTATFSGDITGTLATASQGNITSVGTLTSLTVDDITINGSTISDAGAFDIDAGGVIKLDAGGGQIQFFDDGTEIGVFENSSSDFVMESKVQDKDIIFKGNDGGSGITALTLDMSEGGNATFSGEVLVDSYFSLRTTDDQANRWLLYTHTDDTFRMNYNGSGGDELKVETDGTVVIPGAIQSTGNVSITSTAKYFQVMSHTDTSKVTKHAYDGLYTSGSQNQFISSAQDIKFYPGGVEKVKFADGGLATFSGTVLIDGLSNYTGLEVKGSGGSRPQIKWSNANNGNIGSIYGTEGNELVFNTGTSLTTTLTLNSNQSASFSGGISTPKGVGYVVHSVNVASGSSSSYNLNGMGGNCAVGFYAGACKRDASTTADNCTHIGVHQHTQGSNTFNDLLTRNDDADVTLARSGNNLTCTNNGNSTVNFIVKYFNLIALDGSNNLA